MPLRVRESVRVLLVFAILIVGWAPGAIAAPPPSPSSSALAAFERFRAMDGTWEGRSTKGWQESISFKTIAGRSAVVETSFDAHPGETMLTVFHLDGEDLTLTEGFRWEPTLRTWLCGIAVNCWRELRRRSAAPELASAALEDDPPDFGPLPAAERVDLERAVRALPDGYREAVVLHDVHGYTHQEISVLLGIDAGTSKSQLSRGRRSLREMLGDRRAAKGKP
ncbi:MAG: RNA polymerase sigma factor [Acidobacteriota bacterium]|nr:RNA polymerase sigma factor [Acidobacteriota bacterium]